LFAVGVKPVETNNAKLMQGEAMNKLIISTALVAAAFLISSTNVQAQVRVNNGTYRQVLVRPVPQPVTSIRVATLPSYNYGVYSSPYRTVDYYRPAFYPYPIVTPYPYSYPTFYPSVVPTYTPYVLPAPVVTYPGSYLPY